MPINHWPQNERPREKLLRFGTSQLSDAELLAIFFRTGVAGKSAVDLARDLLCTFGGLRQLLSASQATLCSHKGVGETKYALLQAALELGRRHLHAVLERGNALTNPDDTKRYLSARLRDYSHEVFACLFLDNRHRIIEYAEMFRGSLDGAHVYPREIVKSALHHNAAAVIFAHNHPSGVAEPSRADISLTGHLSKALALLDIRVLDHLVIGDGQIVSLAERGQLG